MRMRFLGKFKFKCQLIIDYSNDINHKLCVHTRMGDLKGTFQESDLSFTDSAIEFVGKELKVRGPTCS
jgi:hypothetical protein